MQFYWLISIVTRRIIKRCPLLHSAPGAAHCSRINTPTLGTFHILLNNDVSDRADFSKFCHVSILTSVLSPRAFLHSNASQAQKKNRSMVRHPCFRLSAIRDIKSKQRKSRRSHTNKRPLLLLLLACNMCGERELAGCYSLQIILVAVSLTIANILRSVLACEALPTWSHCDIQCLGLLV